MMSTTMNMSNGSSSSGQHPQHRRLPLLISLLGLLLLLVPYSHGFIGGGRGGGSGATSHHRLPLVVRQPRTTVTTGVSSSSSQTGRRSTTTKTKSSRLQATQLLEFIEPTTGVTVKLVGAMHYNPTSIQLTEDTISTLADEGRLGSVLIESCDIRWNATLNNKSNGPPFIDKLFSSSEMKSGYDLAKQYNVPIVLGDQRINITLDSLSSGLKQTFLDLTNPTGGGWKNFINKVGEARALAVPFGDQYLGINSFFDWKLLLASPVSLFKYPFSYFVRSPLATSVVLSLLFWSDSSNAATTMTSSGGVSGGITPADLDPYSMSDIITSVAGSVIETIFFARIFLKELLADRNEVLAREILKQCHYYKSDESLTSWNRFLRRAGVAAGGSTGGVVSVSTTETVAGDAFIDTDGTVYAEGSTLPQYDGTGTKEVVAVLGMAHCNGIRKLLEEQRVSLV